MVTFKVVEYEDCTFITSDYVKRAVEASELPPGKLIRMDCETKEEARRVRMAVSAANKRKNLGLEIKMSGLVVTMQPAWITTGPSAVAEQ